MAALSGIVLVEGQAKDNVTVRLYSSAQVASPPAKDTALPASAALQTVTTGDAHGGDGAYRFTGVSAGVYYAAASYNGSILWDSFDVTNPTNARSVKDYGAVGDGLTNDTTAVQAALNDTAYGIVTFPAGSYSCSALEIANRTNLVVEGQGGAILWDGTAGAGDQIGLRLRGVNTNVKIRDLEFMGDGVAANGHAGVWWKNTDSPQQIAIEGCWFKNVVRGVCGTRTSSGTWNDLRISGCFFERCTGTGASQGEGVCLTTNASVAINASITDNLFSQSDQYSVHLSQGIGAVVRGNRFQNHRLNTATAAVKAAVRVNRFQDVRIEENYFYATNDGAIEVTPTAGTTTRAITIAGNQFIAEANAIPEITIGTADPATDGAPEEIQLLGNTLYRTNRNCSLVDLRAGLRVAIRDNLFAHLLVTTSPEIVTLEGRGDSGGTRNYSDDIEIEGNSFYATTSGGSVPAIALQAAFCTSTARAAFRGNRVNTTSTFSVGTNVTNDNLTLVNHPDDGLTFDATSLPLNLATGPMRVMGSLGAPAAVGANSAGERVRLVESATQKAGIGANTNDFWFQHLRGAAGAGAFRWYWGNDSYLSGGDNVLTLKGGSLGIGTGATTPASALHVDGQIQAKTATYTSTGTSHVDARTHFVDGTAGAFTLTLGVSAVGKAGMQLVFIRTSAAGNVTIDPAGAETINGAATKRLDTQYASMTIESDGAAWYIVAHEGTIT